MDVARREIACLRSEVEALQSDRQSDAQELARLRQEVSELRSQIELSSPIQVVGRDVDTLENAVKHATPYSVVEVPEGNHRFECLRVDKPITIRKCATARKFMTKLKGSWRLEAQGAKIESVCLHRDKDSRNLHIIMISALFPGRFDRESDTTISNCDLTMGIHVSRSVPTLIRHCVFHECSIPRTLHFCISLGDDSNARVESCIMKDIGDAMAVSIHGNAEGHFSSNVIHGSWKQPAFDQTTIGRCTIEENNMILCPVWHAASEVRPMRRRRGRRRHR